MATTVFREKIAKLAAAVDSHFFNLEAQLKEALVDKETYRVRCSNYTNLILVLSKRPSVEVYSKLLLEVETLRASCCLPTFTYTPTGVHGIYRFTEDKV